MTMIDRDRLISETRSSMSFDEYSKWRHGKFERMKNAFLSGDFEQARKSKEDKNMNPIKWNITEVEVEERSGYTESPTTIHAHLIGTPCRYAERITIADHKEFKRYIERRLNASDEDQVEIKNVIFNPPATIVFWSDGTKTVVKAQGEFFDPEKGLAMAMVKKVMGNKGNYFNEIKKWTSNYPKYTIRADLGATGDFVYHPAEDLTVHAKAVDEALQKVVEAAKSLLVNDKK